MDDDISLYSRRWRQTIDDRDSRTVTASPEEIRYAEQLRVRIREAYLRRATPTLPWTTRVE